MRTLLMILDSQTCKLGRCLGRPQPAAAHMRSDPTDTALHACTQHACEL
jgi:hypothetical protein